MSLVPPRVWVIANFKETQFAKHAAGTTSTVSIDAYQELKYTDMLEAFRLAVRGFHSVAAGKRDGQLCESSPTRAGEDRTR